MKLQPHHAYTADYDVPPDHLGRRLCTCGRPERNEVHHLPPVPRDVTEAEARRLGESTDD
jgi:hypothetical protein